MWVFPIVKATLTYCINAFYVAVTGGKIFDMGQSNNSNNSSVTMFIAIFDLISFFLIAWN